MKVRYVLACAPLLAACSTDIRDIGREPHMTPVGSGLSRAHMALDHQPFPPPERASLGSLWRDSGGDLFRDQRANKAGDILTINISINDRASFGNSTDRSKESKVKSTLDYAANLFGLAALGAASADIESTSSTKGQGAIDRSEKIQLSLAAVISQVLPNGNFLITGSQEIRVNFELRVLEISGIVRPRDISRDNTISYDKIAEARVSYGGRGRLMEVQQPNLVHQVYDVVKPF
ncbi:MAG TPA: flagellar basal body L-ring protein FlgH [Beijerinckiaceae bacterium]|jgi:flagellar L-ring protein precursor FlgH